MMHKKLIILYLAVFLLLPVVVSADIVVPDPPAQGTLNITAAINKIINFIWPIFGAVAIIIFISAGYLYLTARGDPTKISLAHKTVMWGIIGVAVAMFASTIPWIINNILLS